MEGVGRPIRIAESARGWGLAGVNAQWLVGWMQVRVALKRGTGIMAAAAAAAVAAEDDMVPSSSQATNVTSSLTGSLASLTGVTGP